MKSNKDRRPEKLTFINWKMWKKYTELMLIQEETVGHKKLRKSAKYPESKL